NSSTADFSYCTILDTRAPTIAVTDSTHVTWLAFQFADNQPWDRGLGIIKVTSNVNTTFGPDVSSMKVGAKTFSTQTYPSDVTKDASFNIQVLDSASNASSIYSFSKKANTNGVSPWE